METSYEKGLCNALNLRNIDHLENQLQCYTILWNILIIIVQQTKNY